MKFWANGVKRTEKGWNTFRKSSIISLKGASYTWVICVPAFVIEFHTRSSSSAQSKACSPSLPVNNNSIMKSTWCTLHWIYWESKASICFEHYLFILRRRMHKRYASHPEDGSVMLETRRGLWFSINLMKIASRWFHYIIYSNVLYDQQNIKSVHVSLL
jgi:hypothetical protein